LEFRIISLLNHKIENNFKKMFPYYANKHPEINLEALVEKIVCDSEKEINEHNDLKSIKELTFYNDDVNNVQNTTLESEEERNNKIRKRCRDYYYKNEKEFVKIYNSKYIAIEEVSKNKYEVVANNDKLNKLTDELDKKDYEDNLFVVKVGEKVKKLCIDEITTSIKDNEIWIENIDFYGKSKSTKST
jgi:hypothetical protein